MVTNMKTEAAHEARIDNNAKVPITGGWIFYKGVTQPPIGALPQPGWASTYAMIGSTGKLADARGVKRPTLLADGITFKAVITLVK